MTDDTYVINGYSECTTDDGVVPTIQITYQVWGKQYDTELFLGALTGTQTPTAEDLTTALQSWIDEEAKPQLAPKEPIVSADLENLITETD